VGGRPDEISFESSAIDVAFRAADIYCVRFPQPPPANGTREVYGLVIVVVFAVRHWDWLGYVPVFALMRIGASGS
jgi:hypothetical protein